MKVLRGVLAVAVIAAAMGMGPASAQFYFKPKDFSTKPVTGEETVFGLNMPGATPVERDAALTWTLRAALNVAALQCQFEPTLLALTNYNAILKDHSTELMDAYNTVGKYFARTAANKKAGQTAFDQFGTHVYSLFSSTSQFTFCQVAGKIMDEAVFAPRGGMAAIARARLMELHDSLVPYGEQQFPGRVVVHQVALPRLDEQCWDRDGDWNMKKCGNDLYGRTQVANR